MDETSYSYDEIPYPSHPFEATHPDHIYTLARLFKLEAKLPDNARVLELGCAGGGNIIPLAAQMPNCEVVGVDLSSRQIDDGKKIVEALGLKNISLRAQDFQSIDESFGQFDYILCHGVFSWVPPFAQQRILEVCQERLTDNGVGYISYNCYPGWFMRGMIRQMMLHHVGNIQEPKGKIQQARALLNFLVESTEGQETPYAKIVKSELDLLAKHPDSYLFHEHLEENNRPMFFYEFVEMAKNHKLQFLGESSLASMVTNNLPTKAAEALSKLTNDVHHRGQYTDFVTNRMFRQSLVCREGVKLNRNLDLERIQDGYFTGNIRVEGEVEAHELLSPEKEVTFKCANGRKLQTKHPVLKALILSIGESWPAAKTIGEIREDVQKKLAETLTVGATQEASLSNVISSNLMQLLVRGDIECKLVKDRFTTAVSEKPSVSPLARYQATGGGAITTLRHGMFGPDALTRLLLPSIDGTKSQQDIAAFLNSLIDSGKVNVNVQGDGKIDMPTVTKSTVEKVLEVLRKAALLLPA